MKPTFEQVIAHARANPGLTAADLETWAATDLAPPEPIPGPYELAKTFMAALIMTGRYQDDMGACAAKAWILVWDFYAGKKAYEEHGRQLAQLAGIAAGGAGPVTVALAASPDEPLSRQEARAWVGAETGDTGEVSHDAAGAIGTIMGVPIRPTDAERAENDRKAAHIRACALRVQKAATARDEAHAALEAAENVPKGRKGRKARVDAARAAYNAAEAEWTAATQEQSAAYL